ncbi:MAG: hypothetical protein H6807_11240 [Planctomycetes bacterium]|nr:hypothetical protein [Planctomycetota bacterium]
MRMKRHGSRKRIVVPGEESDGRKPATAAQEPLVVALARGHHWRDLIESGQYGGVSQLAAGLGVDRSYVGRMIRLTLLAPDIVEAIIRGREPSGLSLARLVREGPLRWDEQRGALGFARA